LYFSAELVPQDYRWAHFSMTISKHADVIPTDCAGVHLEHGLPASDWYLLYNNVVWCMENGSQHIRLIL
jgi:hypothetical protein